MRIHHLDAGSMRPPGAPLVCHVLLIESPDGVAIVDTGFGLKDVLDPQARLGSYRRVIRPVLDPNQTAVAQVQRLGLAPGDVRHIFLTHLDSDHAGGLADFPEATVHTTATEWDAARSPRTMVERNRYRRSQWAHGPRIVTHEPGADQWHGFSVTSLDHLVPGLAMIAMPGHTRGHAAYLVERPGRDPLLHAGDSFYHSSVLDGVGREPVFLRLQERAVAMNWRRVRSNHERLSDIHARPDGVRIVSAHDPGLLSRDADDENAGR